MLGRMIAWDEQWRRLRRGEVYPVPLATETNLASDGWEVQVIVLMEVSDGGHSSIPIWTHKQPYRDAAGESLMTNEEAERVTQDALAEFAARLRDVLARGEQG